MKKAHVLIMDDDRTIQVLLSKILKRMDCEVDCASEGETALTKYKAALPSSNPFDLVILDLVVPHGLGGIQTMHELRKIQPNVKVILSSGYLTDVNVHHYENHGNCAILKKPYTVDEVKYLINSCLLSSSGPHAT